MLRNSSGEDAGQIIFSKVKVGQALEQRCSNLVAYLKFLTKSQG